MRLGQLARKLSRKPSELVDFLAAKNIPTEGGINTRLETDHIHLLVQALAPAKLAEIIAELTQEEDEPAAQPTVVEEPIVAAIVESAPVEVTPVEVIETPVAVTIAQPEVKAEVATVNEEVEVIKAPKVELQGLKVLGKIELPEPKKKEQPKENTEGGEVSATTEQSRPVPQPRRTPPQRRERPEQRPYKNPIAAKREQEELEAARKRKEQAERNKEKRTQNYMKRVKSAPTKGRKIVDEEVTEVIEEEVAAPPKTWLGKLFRWFKS